ncbi:MAG: carbamoyltransferase HypF [Deltaproteobacteria bacterium]|nr:carbamoyltransferase HypF [Deltaproteobacteria bacterium]
MIHLRLQVYGTVQGVGFRPTVYRLAREEGLSGWVLNDGRGVEIALQGPEASVGRFQARLPVEVEPPGRVERVEVAEAAVQPELRDFHIAESGGSSERSMSLAADGRVCRRCLEELADPSDRRFRYPFVNCTRCGPRYTIVQGLPYDRPLTTMAGFALCPDCAREYGDPLDRRHHAQPIACPVCGPWAWLARPGDGPEAPARPDDPAVGIDGARAALLAGEVVAIRGLGGFHLAVNARDPAAVALLRSRKGRGRKPLALMVRGLEQARALVSLETASEALLLSPAAPIVIAPARDLELAERLAPGVGALGVMLPTTPLHQLLFEDGLDALVMTSGNRSQEPILTDAARALAELPADAFLLHNRPIAVGVDDSVARQGPRGPVLLRRARGYVPQALDARALPPVRVLALGAHLKVTLATLCRGELVLSRHLGDLDNPLAEEAWLAELQRMLAFGRVEPEVVACDQHPDLFSTEHALTALSHLPLVRVQHHHAHMAAVMVEHGLGPEDRAVGVILDGLGYAPDGTVWGGEVLVGGYRRVERAAHLRLVPQPGGDQAAREPRRMASALLELAGRREHPLWDPTLAQVGAVRAVSPLTSSAGRLFDGVAALLGLAPTRQAYDAEAPALLEAAADPHERGAYPLPLDGGVLDSAALVGALLDDPAPAPVRAARFHRGLAEGLAAAAATAAGQAGVEAVVLGGGSLANQLLFGALCEALERRGLRPLWPTRLPAGDGGLSAGQAAVAACAQR